MRSLPAVLVSTFLLVPSMLQAQSEPEHRPFSEMQGDCEGYSLNVRRELGVWDKVMAQAQSGTTMEDAPWIPLASRIDLKLREAGTLSLPAKPERIFEHPGRDYAGVLRVAAKAGSTLKVSLSRKAWVDVVDPASRKVLAPSGFEMQTHCEKVFKTVLYKIERDRPVLLQVSSSPSRIIGILVNPMP